MYKKTFMLLAASLMLLTSLGCKTVYTTSIAGTPSAQIASEIEGTWKLEDGIVYIKALEDGKFMMANVDWKKNQWKLTQRIIIATETDNHKLLYMGNSEPEEGEDNSKPITDNDDKQYAFLKLLYHGKKPDIIIVYPPDPEAVAKAIEAGKLKGTFERDDKGKVKNVISKSNTDEFQTYLKDTPTAELFQMEAPITLVRMK